MRAGAAFALALALHAMPSRAAVWGYIDADGKAHIATEKLDHRYQLFFKGKTDGELAADAAAKAAYKPAEAFVRTPLFRRLEDNPDIARYEPLIAQHAKAQGVDVALVKALVAVESAYDAAALSNKGAIGLMQVLPDTAERYGVTGDAKRSVEEKLRDPVVNVRVGTRYLKDLLTLFDGDIALALAGYNAGEGAVLRHDRRVPPYPETQEFVRLVQQFHALYTPPAPPPPAPARITIPRRPTVAP